MSGGRPFRIRCVTDVKWNEETSVKLGEGAFGTVYLGKVMRWGEPMDVAVKKLKYVPKKKKEQIAFFREAEISERLYFPSILNLLKWHAGGEKYLLISERGVMSLDRVVKQERTGTVATWTNSYGEEVKWDLTKKLTCIAGTAFGIAYLHKMGIIHRDLKPENILLDEDMRPHIADFGLSVMLPSGSDAIERHFTLTGDVGTPLYMAPEVMLDPHYNGQADVYAFAMILLELMTNKQPWEGMNMSNYHMIASTVVQGHRPDIPAYVPPRIRELIQKCWQPCPDDRPTMAQVCETLSAEFLDPQNGEDFDKDSVDEYIQMLREALEAAKPRRH